MTHTRRTFFHKALAAAAVPALPGLWNPLLAAGSLPKIKITAVKIHRLSQPLKEPMGYCCAAGGTLGMKAVGASVIEVETDSGITGWGDGGWGGEVLRRSRDLVIGRSPSEAEAIFDDIGERSAPPFQVPPRSLNTPGGLDVALWDIMG